jgi:endonuclease/exonuclease/phosphatase family metal-dependent hydrolase
MRLASYNILDGGEGRADPLAEVILAQKADVVAIIEADDPAVLDRLSHRLNMDYIHGQGPKSSTALFSRWPIRDSINYAAIHPGITKAFLEATVIDPTGKKWQFGVIHLPAHAAEENERQREKELQIILDAFKPLRESRQPHILCGDFNSNSPVQKIDIARCKESTQIEYAKNGHQIPRRVIQKLLDAGYIDTLHAADPRAGKSTGTFSTQHPGQRVDYIFAFGFQPRAIRSAWIETDRLAKYASDHFPVAAEIEK